MTIARGVILILLIAVVGAAIWRFTSEDAILKKEERSGSASRAFPELKPAADAPPGFRWDYHNGPDYYVWRLLDIEEIDEAPRSGIGIHFGVEPKKPVENAKLTTKPGKAFNQDAAWLADESPDADVKFRQDAYLDYKHDSNGPELKIHVWIWAHSAEQLAELGKLVEGMRLVPKENKK